jgi:hypothetical protein
MASLRSCLGAVLAFSTVLLATSAAGQSPPPAAPAQAAPAAATRLTEPAIANYLSWRLNNKILPVTDRATDSTGTQFLIEFDELILSIRPNHEFRASLRFRQTLASRGMKLGQDPIQKTTVYGTWSAEGKELRFVPDPKRGGGGLNILSGTFAGTRIDVPFDYRNGSLTRRATVVLMRNDNIF